MTKQMQNAINQIFKNKELSKKLIKLETLDEIFELFKSISSEISKEDFEEGVNELLEKSGEKLPDESLIKVSGGVISENLRKPIAATLAALSLGITPIKAAPKAENKASKPISNALLAALGITSATALGTAFYILMNTNENSSETKLKKFYYEILKILGSDQLLEICKKFQQILKENKTTALLFNEFFTKNNIHPENLNLEQIRNLLLDEKFFNLIPLDTLHYIFPEEIETELQEILENKNESSQTQKTPTSFIKGLPNIGNSCHLNATLQLLRQIPEIREGNVQLQGEATGKTVERINSLNKVMQAINNSKGTVADKNFEGQARELLEFLYPRENEQQDEGLVRKLLKFLYPGEDKQQQQQDASEDLLKLDLPLESLGIKSLFSFDLAEADIENINSNPQDSGGDQSNNSKYKLFIINTPNKKFFEESYTLNENKYELKCVVCHSEGIFRTLNHYYAYSKDENGVWHKCNDGHITDANFETIKDNPTLPTMFLYSRVDKT